MEKFSHTAAAVDTNTDPGVLANEGNLAYALPSAGDVGLAFNIAAVAICASLRAYAEWAPKPKTLWQEILKDSQTSLLIAGLIQEGVAVVAVVHGTDKSIAIPLTLFCLGNIVATRSSELVKQTGIAMRRIAKKLPSGKQIHALFRAAKQRVTTSVNAPVKKTFEKSKQVANQILLRPEPYWTTGLTIVGGSKWAAIPIISAGVQSVCQEIVSKPDENSSIVGRVLKSPFMPSLLLMAGNEIAATQYFLGGATYPGIATTLYGAVYLSIYAAQRYGKFSNAMRHGFILKQKSAASAAPA